MKGGLLAFLLGFTFVTPAFAQGSKSFEYDFGKALQTAPAVDLDGTIYIGGKGSIAAIAPSGTEMWKTNVFSGSASDFGAISIDTDRIYATTSEGVFAFGKNGSRLWTNNIKSVASAVAISSDGTVFVGGSDGTVYGLNRNGSLIWTNHLDDPSTLAMPAGLLAVGDDGKVYVARGILYALDPNDGHILWAGTEQAGKSSPLIGAGGNIYYAGLPELASFKSVSAAGTNLWLMPMIGVPEGAVFNENSGRIYVAASGSLYTAQTEGIKSLTLNGSSNWVFNVGNPQGTDVLPVTLNNDDVVVAIGAKVYALSEQGTLKWGYDLTDKAVKGLAVGPNHDIYAAQANGKLTAITGSSPLASNGWPVYGGNARHTGQRTTSVGVVMIAPDLVTTNSAHLTVQVNPAFANGTVYFQYSNGTTTNSVAVEVASTNIEPNISTSLSNLLEGTIYGVHAILSNSVQIVTSEDMYFRTLGASGEIAPTLTALQGAAALGESVTFSEDGVITAPSPILFSKTNIIDANGHAVVLSGAGMNPILKMTSTAQLTLAGITFANGKAQGEYTEDGTHLANGGAIINDGGELTITGVRCDK
ncbi:MAG: outer membrane protein assembly factor BamB family protein [Verrucomicrobiota bacterium]